MNFEDFLASKKIDSNAFKSAEQNQWMEWKELFEQMSAESFTAQKLFLINGVRRKFILKVTETVVAKPVATASRPVIKPKPKIN